MRKLTVNIREDILNPLERKYTLTHSDETGMRFLFIDSEYAEEEYDEIRDEVIARWYKKEDNYYFKVSCPLTCKESKYTADERLEIFKRHMPRALKAIIGGDSNYINLNKELLDATIHTYYCYDDENKVFEEKGKVKEYL